MTAIRLIGEHHNSHRRQTVLTIGHEEVARNSPHIVTLEHARKLVATVSPNGSARRPHSRMIRCPKILNRAGKIEIEVASPRRGAEAQRRGNDDQEHR